MNELKAFVDLLPIGWYVIPIFSFIAIFFKLAPISHFTADPAEEKMFSKETSFILKSFRYLYFSFFWFVLLFGVSSNIKINVGTWGLTVSIIIAIGLLLYILVAMERKNNWKTKLRLNKFLVWTYWFFLVASIIQLIPPFDLETDSDELIFSSLVLCLLSALFIPYLLKQGAYLINYTKVKSLYIKETCPCSSEELVWYIHYSFNKEFVLVGNKEHPADSNLKKIIPKAKLVDQIIFSEDKNSKGTSAEGTNSEEKQQKSEKEGLEERS